MPYELIGSVGVGMILLAYLLNLVRWLSEGHPAYLLLNFVGAGLACWYAWAGGAIPFVVLEGIWCLAAVVKLLTGAKRKAPLPQ